VRIPLHWAVRSCCSVDARAYPAKSCTWGDVAHSVRTGEPAFDHVYGKPFFDYLAEDRAFAKIFIDVMTSASSDKGASIAAAHDFSRYRRIVDAGGHGALLTAVLDRYPGPLGVLFDLPDVVGDGPRRHRPAHRRRSSREGARRLR